jgi:predicted translin family RNA/ssDNA-binding protein
MNQNQKIDFSTLKKEYANYDSFREKLILQSRVVLKASKKLIYSVHKSNKSESESEFIEAKKEFKKLCDILSKNEDLKNEGSFSEACQEYTEGVLYYDFVFGLKLRSCEEIGVTQDDYLLAVADLTGELVRRAVSLVIKGKKDDVYDIYDFVEYVYKELLDFDFRNGNLRKKFDSIRWNLNKLEDILYDLEIKNGKITLKAPNESDKSD